MRVALLLTVYLCCAGLSLGGLAFLLYRYDRHSPEQRNIAGVTFSAGGAALALASLVWMESRLTTKAASPPPVQVYTDAQPRLPAEGARVRE